MIQDMLIYLGHRIHNPKILKAIMCGEILCKVVNDLDIFPDILKVEISRVGEDIKYDTHDISAEVFLDDLTLLA